MTSNPFRVAATGEAIGVTVGFTSGEAVGDAVGGVGDAGGVAVALSRLKLAHGFGGTGAQGLCTPGASAGIGWTRLVKPPLLSAVAAPAPLVGWPRYSGTGAL